MNASVKLADSIPAKNWQARLDLGFAPRFDRTALIKREHLGPLTVQRPFYPEGATCHLYLLHPPGGVVEGDSLQININAEPKSHCLLTTPAAGKFYRCETLPASQRVDIHIAEDAIVEWLPQETIFYQGTRVKSAMTINLSGSARFIGWELLVLGRPASGESFDQGNIDLNWHIAVDGKSLLLERLRLDQAAFNARWGMQRFSACGTLFAKPATKTTLAAVQSLIGDAYYRGATLIDDLLICRALDPHCDRMRHFFDEVYSLVRPELVGKKISVPRIWAT